LRSAKTTLLAKYHAANRPKIGTGSLNRRAKWSALDKRQAAKTEANRDSSNACLMIASPASSIRLINKPIN
jgi:hypothetical protein